MAAAGPDAAGTLLQNFRLIERVSVSVWRAEDVRNSKAVAVKILSKGLPKDPVKREKLIRDVRLNAALYHSFLVGIQEVVAVGDSLLLVMEWLHGQPLAERVHGRAVARDEFFRIAYQVLDALKLLHAKNIVHGNIAGDSIIVLPTGHVKVAGLNLGNILPRQGQPSQYQQKANNLRAVSYMAPEQITNQTIMPATDIFSVGLVMYEMATGRLPYQAATASDVAHKIVDEQPPSPKAVNPNIDNAVLSMLGGCLFKDPYKRFKDARVALDAVTRVDVDAPRFALEVARAAAAPPAGAPQPQARTSILFAADIVGYDDLMATDPTSATRQAARMQQLLGEAVYLFDGKVLDSLGGRVIAELPSAESATEAARKCEFDFSPEQQGADPIPVRMLLHAGEVNGQEGAVGGSGVERALAVLQQLPPLVLHVSEEFIKRGKTNVRYRDAGARAGMKLSTIAAAEPEDATEAASIVTDADLLPVEEPAPIRPVRTPVVVAGQNARAPSRKSPWLTIGIAAMAVIAIVALAAVFVRRRAPETAPLAAVAAPPTATPAAPRKVFLSVTGADPSLAARADAVQRAVISIVQASPQLRVADAAGSDVSVFNAQMRTGAAGPEIVTDDAAAPAPDAASAVQSILQRVSSRLKVNVPGAASAEAYNAFADALTADAANDKVKTEAALRAATHADPNFVAAQLMALRFFASQNKQADAADAARHLLASAPGNIDAARVVARTALAAGDPATALTGYSAVLSQNGKDSEALNAIGKYAVAVGDEQKVRLILARLSSIPATAEIHDPDLMMASGHIDAAVQKYYEIEEKVPNNPSLSVKIGRIAVLRHSTPIAELELKKLQQSDPAYRMHILRAYLAAQSGNKTEANAELKLAAAAMTPGDDYWTTAAEVAAISGNVEGIIDALQRAAERKEPTATYILHDPLFTFLGNDARFQKVRESLAIQQDEIRTALAAVSL